MTGKDTIAGYLASAAKHLREEFEHIKDVNPHAGERGGEIEAKVREFLNQHMPQRFRATAGIVIDIDSQTSNHEDVIVYDALSAPLYRYQEKNQIVAADAVAAIIEVKSLLNKKELENAYAKIAEVKSLKKRPESAMDQKTTESDLSSVSTLGVVLGFTTDTKLETLAQHCVDLNENYDSDERPDLIVILDEGVITYTMDYVGWRSGGQMMPPASEDFVIPPCYVQLTVRPDGIYSLNRFFTIMITHLAFFPRRPSIPPLNVLLEGASNKRIHLATYQYNTERRLVRLEPTEAPPSESTRIIKLWTRTKEHMGTLTFIPWQDGGVVRMRDVKVPLQLILKITTDETPHVMNVEHGEMSMVLKLTRPQFEKWPEVIEKRSDMKATLEVPPPFEVGHIMKGGTGEPFMARLFLGVTTIAHSIIGQEQKSQFEDAYGPCLMAMMEMWKTKVTIKDLINGHRNALQKGSIVKKKKGELVVTEHIDGPLRSQMGHFLETASEVIDKLPAAMKYLGIDISYYAANELKFNRGYDKIETTLPDVATYLRKWRPTLLRIKERFKEMRYSGWNIPNIIYVDSEGTKAMKEPKVDDVPVAEYVEGVFDTLVLGVEELCIEGLQRKTLGMLMIDEIPLTARDPNNAQRFKMNMKGRGVEWHITWSGKGFYES